MSSKTPTIYLFLIAAGLIFLVAFAAQDPLTAGPKLMEMTIRPTTNPIGGYLTFDIEAKLLVAKTGPDGRVESQKLEVFHFDLAKTNSIVVIDGVTLDDREAIDHLTATVFREWFRYKRDNPDALPVTRRTLRAK